MNKQQREKRQREEINEENEFNRILLDLENELDKFIMFSTDTNFDYLSFLTNSLNINTMTNTLMKPFLINNEINVNIRRKLTSKIGSKTTSLSNHPLLPPQVNIQETSLQPVQKLARIERFNEYPLTNDYQNLYQTDKQTIRAYGGGTNNECNGDMIYEDSPLYQNFLDLSRFKTEEERDHDFKGDNGFTHNVKSKLKNVYEEILTKMHKSVPNNNLSQLFDHLYDSSSVGEKEWNYYKSILQYIDKECGNLNKLTIVKYCGEDFFKGDTQTKEALIKDGYFITLLDKRYFMLTMDNQPVEIVFDLKDIQLGFEDNGAPFKMLAPMVMDTENGNNGRNISPDSIQVFLNSIIRLYYGPGMCDPKNTASTPMRKFWSINYDSSIDLLPGSLDTNQLLRFQIQQDINCPVIGEIAKRELIGSLQSFFEYFGSKLIVKDVQFMVSKMGGTDVEQSLRNQLQEKDLKEYTQLMIDLSNFVEGNEKKLTEIPDILNEKIKQYYYVGIKITFEKYQEFLEVVVGDNNIENVRNLIEELSSGMYPYTGGNNLSWNRLIKIAKLYYNEIPGDKPNDLLLVLIVILKSLGDSLQVNYVKRMIPYFNKENVTVSISSTDKNVGTESLLYDSNILLAGTGIRPHTSWLENNPAFFTSNYVSEGADTITTNLSLANEEKYIDTILDTYTKMTNYFVAISLLPSSEEEEEEEEDGLEEIKLDVEEPVLWSEKLELDIKKLITLPSGELESLNSKRILLLNSLETILESGILNKNGYRFLNTMIEEYCESIVKEISQQHSEKEILVILEEINKFIKNVFDVIRYCDTELQKETTNDDSINESIVSSSTSTTDKESIKNDEQFSLFDFGLLMQKIETFNSIEFIKAISIIEFVTKDWDLRKKYKSMETALQNFQNIERQHSNIFTLLQPFIQKYMSERYIQGMITAENKYNEMLIQFKEKMVYSMENMMNPPEVRKTDRAIVHKPMNLLSSLNERQFDKFAIYDSTIQDSRKKIKRLTKSLETKIDSVKKKKTNQKKTNAEIKNILKKGIKKVIFLNKVKKQFLNVKEKKDDEKKRNDIKKKINKLNKVIEQVERNKIKLEQQTIEKLNTNKQNNDPNYVSTTIKTMFVKVIEKVDVSISKLYNYFTPSPISNARDNRYFVDVNRPPKGGDDLNTQRFKKNTVGGNKLNKERKMTKKRRRIVKKYKTVSNKKCKVSTRRKKHIKKKKYTKRNFYTFAPFNR